ncbi:flocculation protein FLO11-like [Zingiber officinale]|uniref:Uncharacterized protein n=1 Tax=Zingiber officinale TaxID=94328 RepID=A0A8J5I0K5_ZINOF|nr:flocculation protein FLO11-like [Zingiber officinale]KAG6524527.1 hypothetical protein ZIOFF_014439 [Zingiber officinale]
MNSSGSSSNRGARSSASGASFDSYQFDFGIAGSGRGSASRPLKDQKPTASYGAPSPAPAPSWSHQPSRPSWTPAAAPSATRSGNLNGPASMVGDIFGKSWGSTTPAAGIGIPKSDSNLFGDLVGSALGQGRGGSGNVPLKSAPPKNAFGMGNLSDSLPRPTANATSAASSAPIRPNGWGSADQVGNLSSFSQPGPKIGAPMSTGGQPMKSMGGMPKPDPFGSLGGFGSNSFVKSPAQSVNSSGMNSGDFSFGAFQNANSTKIGNSGNSSGSFSSPLQPPPLNPPKDSMDPLDSFFSSSAASAPASEAPVSQQFSEMTDWDMGSEFGGHDNGGPTTELEGLPPPPSGVTAPAAKSKGQDNYKQGQYADAIKWLSWAVVLSEKSGDNNSMAEVLSCRASCYKEVGEYKKAVADCSKVLEKDSENISMLVQRALLYESMEKYKLGAEDLRMVLKIDPGNRVARSTIHRLNKFAE